MSLINQMLNDLEQRRGGVGMDDRAVLGGLSAAATAGAAPGRRLQPGVLAALAAVLGVTATLLWLRPELPQRSAFSATSAAPAVPMPPAQALAKHSAGPVALDVAHAGAKPVTPPPPQPADLNTVRQPAPIADAAAPVAAITHPVPAAPAPEVSVAPPPEAPSAASAPAQKPPAPAQPDDGIAEALNGKALAFVHAAPLSPVAGRASTPAADAPGRKAVGSPELDPSLLPVDEGSAKGAPVGRAAAPATPPAPAVAHGPSKPAATEEAVAAQGDVDISPHRPDSQQRSQALYTLALHKLQAGETGRAEAALRRALVADRNNVNARSMLSGVLVQSGRADQAQALLKEGLELMPGEVHFAMQYARILVGEGKVRPALEVLEQAEPDGSSMPEYLAFEGALWQRLGEHEHAVTAYRKALDADPDKGVWWMGLAISLEALQRRDDALDAFRIALHDPSLSAPLRRFVSARIDALSSGRS